MLRDLFVQNYALIEELEIKFQGGFTVITGETGAGKSILLGALALALGNRADLNSLKDKEKKCIIEATFDIHDYNLQPFFHENDLDYEDRTIIRREITPNGKSRAFINDTPVNLNQLKELGENLIDIHSQHQNLQLTQHQFQIGFVDTYAQNEELISKYQHAYNQFLELENEIQELKERNEQQKQQSDFITYQYNELKSAQLKPNEQEEIEQEQRLLSNSEEIAENLNATVQRLNREEFGIIAELAHAKNEISQIVSYFDNGEELFNRLKSALIDLEDITQDLLTKAEHVQHDPKKLDTINQRLDQIYTLQKKHNKQSVPELLEIQAQYEKELNEVNSFDEILTDLQHKADKLKDEMTRLADKLHTSRENAGKEVEIFITKQLKSLGMPQSQFVVETTKNNEFNKLGFTGIQFKFSTDKKIPPKEVTKIASGGELSRIMLVIKSIIATKKSLPTLVFDEIDTGVSGEISNKMAQIMQNMAEQMQIIAITHLPQIAAKGRSHCIVYKIHNQKGATTHIKQLEEKERIHSIAQMLSSGEPTQAALANAAELLRN